MATKCPRCAVPTVETGVPEGRGAVLGTLRRCPVCQGLFKTKDGALVKLSVFELVQLCVKVQD